MARSLAVEMALQQRSVGRRIAELRNDRHLTQEEAADLAGVTLRAYQKWEAGGGIQFANLRKLADIFGTTPEFIAGTADTPNPFQIGDQLTDVREEFHARVDNVEARLDQIAAGIEDLALRHDHTHRLLVAVLETIRGTAQGAGLEVPAPDAELVQLLAAPNSRPSAQTRRNTGSRARARQRAS